MNRGPIVGHRFLSWRDLWPTLANGVNLRNARASFLSVSASIFFTLSTCVVLTKILKAGQLIGRSSFSMNFSTSSTRYLGNSVFDHQPLLSFFAFCNVLQNH